MIKGVYFDKKNTKRIAKIIICVLIGFTSLTTMHDPLHRRLIDDPEEQRAWCVVSYSNNVQLLNSLIKIFHFHRSFVLNFSSATIIIITISRNRLIAKNQAAYLEHIRKQLLQHRNVLISPIILIILNLPRLIISFISVV